MAIGRACSNHVMRTRRPVRLRINDRGRVRRGSPGRIGDDLCRVRWRLSANLRARPGSRTRSIDMVRNDVKQPKIPYFFRGFCNWGICLRMYACHGRISGCSSVGRARDLGSRGREFETPHSDHIRAVSSLGQSR